MDIATLKHEVPIEQYLRFYHADVPRRVSTMGWTAMRCPFHDDQNASASVNYIKNRFNCHTCEVSGDILDLAMKVEGFTRIGDAKQWIEARCL